MSTLSDLIQKRLEEIARECSSVEEALRASPEGKLRVSTSRNNARFFHVREDECSQGRYLRQSEQDLVRRLAQKDYDKVVLSLLRKEEKVLSKAAGYYENTAKRITARGKSSPMKANARKSGREKGSRVSKSGRGNGSGDIIKNSEQNVSSCHYYSGPEELVWSNTIEARRNMIKPVVPDTESFVQKWMDEQYTKLEFRNDDVEYYTRSGIRVRSKSELIIAEMLEARGIPFHYERPLYLKGLGTVHPDFTVLNKKTRKVYFWEHNGMMDEEVYRERTLDKINYYMLNGHFPGIDLILTHETSIKPIKTQILVATIETYLE